MELVQAISTFAGLIVIILAAYYVTYFLGKRSQGRSVGRLRNKNINVLDRFAISRDKSFCLVEIAGKVYVVGMTNQSMTLLDTLDAAAFSEAAATQNKEVTWHTMPGGKYTVRLTKILADFISKKTGRGTPSPLETQRFETFSDSMKAAQEKNPSEQPKKADDSEEL
ncbi:MAG: flagellar biosynthetic protein FliO [Oscillospiraceae bacterium]|nr:flagellar biosynthetic protein FliO [Oscillospiraceae bacterium]